MAGKQTNNATAPAAPPAAAAPSAAPATTAAAPSYPASPAVAQETQPSHPICNKLFLSLLGSLLIVVAVLAVIFLRKAFFHSDGGPKFHVESVNVSSLKVSGSQITGNWDIAIRIENHGKSELQYENVQVSVWYGLQLLSQSAVDPINVTPKHSKTLQARIGASQIIDSQVAASIIEDKKQEAVYFNVELQATYGRITGRKIGAEVGRPTRVHCGDIKVEYSSDTDIGTMLGGPSSCEIEI